ncbi:glycosyltransferase family 4 protein [Candidatus Woesearchaeota archaeon]|nr:glycosyltransferase family 4 protein [Candidatus Woesearchaeota archaeon]
MKKRVLIATDGFLPRWDGISSFMNEIIPKIQDSFDLTVIAPDLGEMKIKYKAEIIRFNTLKTRLGDNYYPAFVNPFVMAKHIRETDVVWVQTVAPIGIWGIILGKLYRKPVLFYNHMLEWEVFPQSQGINLAKVPINILTKFASKILYNMCRLIIVPSIEQAELLNLMGIKSEKKIVHLGVDIDLYKPADKARAKKKIGIDKDKFVVGYAGRVSLEKDPKTLYRAFLRLAKKFPDVLLLIAGGGRPELEKMFSDKPNVILTGLKDNLAPYYQAMDVYVLSSLTETSSLTTMEAMATGIGVVATPVGFVKEYIDDGVNGLFFSKKNSYDLYKKLEYLRENPDTIRELGKQARKTMVEKYSWGKTAVEMKKILRRY